MKRRWRVFFICFLILLLLVIFFKITCFILFVFLFLPCFIMTIIAYNKLSTILEKKCKSEFINDSIYLSTLDLHYLNPLSIYTRKSYSDDECTKLSRLFKAYSLMSLFSFFSMIMCVILSIIS